MGAGAAPGGRLLDRAEELAAIIGAVDSAVAGAGSALLVEGAAGIGKPSLLARACVQAAAVGMTVRVARAAEFEGGYAWGVVRELFQPEVRAGGGGLAGDAAALAAPALGHAAPGGEEDSFSVVHGLYWLTAGIAAQAPLLLAVDDLHWSARVPRRGAGVLSCSRSSARAAAGASRKAPQENEDPAS